MSRPFFSLSDRGRLGRRRRLRKHRVLRFYDGEDVARDSLQHRFTLAYGSVAQAVRAGPTGYLRLGINASVRRDDYAAEARVDTIGKSVTGLVGALSAMAPGPLSGIERA